MWTRHKELTSRVPCLLEAHKVNRTQADHLEGEVQEARSNISRLTEEFASLKLVLEFTEAT